MALPKDLSPEMLERNPSLLLHSRPHPDEITALDGLVGAVVHHGQYIVTSPNSNEIPYPPLGGDRNVFLRGDLRFGDDDPVQWPQPFLDGAPHLGCIPKQPPHETPLAIMWWNPTREYFDVEDHGVIRGIGKLAWSQLRQLKSTSRILIARVNKSELMKSKSLPKSMVKLLEDVLHRLEHISTPFRAVQLGVRAVQRAFLELIAYIDFQEIYKPLMENQHPTSSSTMDRIGAYTTNAVVASRMYQAKLPVWLIRPYRALHSIRIDKVIRAQPAPGIIELNAANRPSYSPIYTGPSTNIEMYNAIVRQILSYLQYPDPFGSIRAEASISPPPPSSGPSKKEIRSQRYTPYAKRKKDPSAASGGRNKFEDPQSPLLPPAIPSWRRSLENVNIDDAQFAYPEIIPTDLGYVFPEPASFLSIQSPDRQKGFFKTWLRYRSTLIYRMSSGASNARPMPNTVWRTLLSGDFISQVNETKQGTRSQKFKEMAKNFLQGCLDAEGVELNNSFDSDAPVMWRGKTFESLGTKDYKEIIWELSELNFRFELMALDSRLTTRPPNSRQEAISACFPQSATGASLLVADLSGANQGLASNDWEDRGSYVLALQNVIRSWRGDLPSIIHVSKVAWSREEAERMEDIITHYYCKTFYNYFRRAPIVPRRLSHTVSPYNPLTPIITIQDPRPNILYDTNSLLPLQ